MNALKNLDCDVYVRFDRTLPVPNSSEYTVLDDSDVFTAHDDDLWKIYPYFQVWFGFSVVQSKRRPHLFLYPFLVKVKSIFNTHVSISDIETLRKVEGYDILLRKNVLESVITKEKVFLFEAKNEFLSGIYRAILHLLPNSVQNSPPLTDFLILDSWTLT